jgi:hypothetical protein
MQQILRRRLPEFRLEPEFIHTLYDTTDVVAEYLAEGFVNLRSVRLALERIRELGFASCGEVDSMLLGLGLAGWLCFEVG